MTFPVRLHRPLAPQAGLSALLCLAAACGPLDEGPAAAPGAAPAAAAVVERILGGHQLPADTVPAVGRLYQVAHPWQAGSSPAQAGCTATMVSSFGSLRPSAGRQLILTAGHCVLTQETGVKVIDPLRVIFILEPNSQHADKIYFGGTTIYLSYTSTSDIAVVEVERYRGSAYLPALDPLFVNSGQGPLQAGALVVAVGYGLRAVDESWQEFLNNPVKGTLLRLQSDSGHFYGLSPAGGTVCSGDSGGPLFTSVNGHRYIAGVASQSNCDLGAGGADIFARAEPAFYGW